MLEFISSISHWIEGFAHSEWVIAILIAVSFTEAIFSPFPPDPILIAASVFNPQMALILALVTTLASVAGALVGYWLGKRFGRPILDRFVSAKKVEQVENLFQKYGVWAVIFAAVTPVPYKVFAVTAGAMELNRRSFIIASLAGRGVRMFLWAVLAIVFGESAIELLETNGLLIGIVFGAAVLAIFVLYLVFTRIRRHRSTEPA